MKNFEIYELATRLSEHFTDNAQYLPVKINFYIQKNKNTLMSLAQDIEANRINIIKNYGNPSESNPDQYIVEEDKIEKASKELDDLFSLEQEVNIYKVNIDSFPDDISLTTGQMEALMFMID
jgi:hypothetical protein